MDEVLEISATSLEVSGIALLIAVLIGISLGVIIGLGRFKGKRFIISLVNTGMGLPPVLVGLVVAILLWRSGPLGFLELLYSRTAMIIAQVIIATPLVMAFTTAGIQRVDPELISQTVALGADRLQLFWILVRETRLTLLAAVMAGFGGIISEVGAVLMVGGNIKGDTQVLTTAIVEKTRQGNFEMALVFGAVLLLISFGINLCLTILQQKETLV
jgi:tungstate transport system permease protein